MNSENSKTSEPYRLCLFLKSMINMLLYQVLAYKKSYKNNKFKVSAPAWNGKFELPDG